MPTDFDSNAVSNQELTSAQNEEHKQLAELAYFGWRSNRTGFRTLDWNLPWLDKWEQAVPRRVTLAKTGPPTVGLGTLDDILVQESPSNVGELLDAWPIVEQETYFTSASGGLGWGAPAAVGIALAQRNRTTVLVIGDGSLHYSVQSIYTAVQRKLNLIILVPRNEEYAILKEFAVFEDTPNCPALDLPGLNAKGVAEAYGCPAFRADTPAALYEAFQEARKMNGPVLIESQINPKLEPLPV